MICRRHGSKPTIALWMLVAVADVALIAVSTGLFTVLLTVLALAAIIGGGVFAARSLGRREPKLARSMLRRRA